MSREIKFRAWDKDREKIIEWQSLIDYCDIDYLFGNIGENPKRDTVPDFEVMQYTGLKDENGVEIYEGDIVENGNGKVGYIVFLIQEAGFVVVLKDKDYRLGHRNTGEGYHMAGNHKVIGNVYTSPELLENN